LPEFPKFSFEFSDLSARRGDRVVVEGGGARLSGGQRLDLAGPNGSGKTSLLRVFAGLIPPSSGAARIALDGAEPRPLAARDIVFVGDRDGLRPEFTVSETLRFWAAFPGMRPPDAAMRALGLDGFADVPVRRLSRGWRRRTALARALMSAAPIWLLDEPFAGLDADGKARFGEALAARLAGGGAAVIARHSADAGPPADMTLRLEVPA